MTDNFEKILTIEAEMANVSLKIAEQKEVLLHQAKEVAAAEIARLNKDLQAQRSQLIATQLQMAQEIIEQEDIKKAKIIEDIQTIYQQRYESVKNKIITEVLNNGRR